MKPSYDQYAKDAKALAIKARRYAHANSRRPIDEAASAHAEFDSCAAIFAARYSISIDDAKRMAIHVAETCNLGLAY